MNFPLVFLLVFIRVAGVVLTAPILGSRCVPFRFRLLVAALISIAALPLAAPVTASFLQPGEIFTAVTSEMVIGVTLGLGVSIMFAAAQAAGGVIAQMAGIQWPSQTNDTGEATTPVSQFFAMLSLAAFALIGGPELVLGSLLDTCIHIPLGTSLHAPDIVALLAQLLQQSFLLTLRGVGPAVAALMISTIVIGLISRTYPQMNMLGIGLNSNQFVMFLAVFLTLGGSVWLFVDDLGDVIAMIQTTMINLQAEVQGPAAGLETGAL
jgi:flagellar biosynthetic protein FliR